MVVAAIMVISKLVDCKSSYFLIPLLIIVVGETFVIVPGIHICTMWYMQCIKLYEIYAIKRSTLYYA